VISDAAADEAKRLGVLRANGSVTTAPLSYGSASPAAVQLDQLTMAEWLEAHVPGVLGTAVGKIIDELMAAGTAPTSTGCPRSTGSTSSSSPIRAATSAGTSTEATTW
jgi:hypothetical protein